MWLPADGKSFHEEMNAFYKLSNDGLGIVLEKRNERWGRIDVMRVKEFNIVSISIVLISAPFQLDHGRQLLLALCIVRCCRLVARKSGIQSNRDPNPRGDEPFANRWSQNNVASLVCA